MAIRYKVNVLDKLKEKGYTTYRIRKEKLMGEATVQKIRTGQMVSWDMLDIILGWLECQPGDILERVDESEVETK